MPNDLAEEHRMLHELVARFVDRELMPLEKAVLAREAAGQKYGLTPEEEAPLLAKCRELGLWALDVPEEFGGANLPTVALMAINEELGRTVRALHLPARQPEPAHAAGRREPRAAQEIPEALCRGEPPSRPSPSPSPAPAAIRPA